MKTPILREKWNTVQQQTEAKKREKNYRTTSTKI
jgi:hypothetical protein